MRSESMPTRSTQCRRSQGVRCSWATRRHVTAGVVNPAPAATATLSKPLVICVQEGLCNRIRAVLSYWSAHPNRPLIVAWPANEFCDGPFLDFFQPLPGVQFAFEPEDLPSGMQLRQEHMVFEAHPDIKGTDAEIAMYAALKPLKGIAAEIERRKPSAATYVAAHIRRTDHWTAGITEEQQTSDASFESFFERHASTDALFLATDNADTQRRFARRFGSLCHKPIATRIDLRQTEVRDAVIELFVCADARVFAGSYGSSFSDTIAHLRSVRGTVHESDEHELMGTEALSGRGGFR
jgi:hypothetical protein